MDAGIPELPGFDKAAALKLLNNNERLYGIILKKFHGQYAGGYEALADTLLNGDDWATIQREAHTIKGLAGTIGHPGLQQAALALELSAKDPDNIVPENIRTKAKEFLEIFSVVLCQLGSVFAV